MVFWDKVGMVYDTIYYGIIYFNMPNLKIIAEKSPRLSQVDYFESYEQLFPKPYALDASLRPFFYYRDASPSFLSNWFQQSQASFREGLTAFTDTFSTKEFADAFSAFCLTMAEVEQPASVTHQQAASLLSKSDLFPHLKQEMLHVLHDFERSLSLLRETMQTVYQAVQSYHESNPDALRRTQSFLSNPSVLKTMARMFRTSGELITQSAFSICYLNPVLLLPKQINEQNGMVLLFGDRYDSLSAVESRLKKLSPEKIFQSMGSAEKFEIIETLHKHGEMTVSQLSRILHISKSAVSRYMIDLNESLIVKISHCRGNEVYYMVNLEFMEYAKKVIDEYFNHFSTKI